MGDRVTQSILTDWRSAPIEGKLRATLGFLEKLTLSPEDIRPDDVALLRAEGLTDAAIIDAIYVCIGFNIINRIADAFDFIVPADRVFVSTAKLLLIFGYRLLSGAQPGRIRDSHGVRPGCDENKQDDVPASNNRLADPYARRFKLLEEAVIFGPGTLDPALRRVASVPGVINGELAAYVKKVWHRAHQIANEDIAALRRIGYSEDQIFELTVCAAVGAGLLRRELGLGSLGYQDSFRMPACQL